MANVEQVQYELTLKDLLTGKLIEADNAAKGLEATMGAVKSALGVLGVGFAIFKGAEFIGESVEKFHKLEEANAQLRAGLESTRSAAGLSFQDIQDGAKDLASHMKYSRTEILAMQSVLLTFPSITKAGFMPASEIIADMSTRLGQDLKSSAIQVGKALQDPIKGVTALRRVGVNFNEAQTETIKKLAETGHMAQAQGLIMKELRVEFEGSARAAFNADPLAGFSKMMGSFSMAVGEAGHEVLKGLAPALMLIGKGFVKAGKGVRAFVDVLKEHSAAIKAVAVGAGLYVSSLILVATWTQAVAAWTAIGTTSQLAYNAAMWAWNVAAAANPVGLVVVAIAALGAGMYYLWQKMEPARAAMYGLWEVMKKIAELDFSTGGLAVAFGTGIGKGVQSFGAERRLNEIETTIDKISDMHDKGTMSAKAYTNSLANVRSALELAHKEGKVGDDDYNTQLARITGMKKGAPGAPGSDLTKDISPKGATGQKSVTINISINKLIETFKISTTNLHESTSKIQEAVANTLLSAINDSSIHASV